MTMNNEQTIQEKLDNTMKQLQDMADFKGFGVSVRCDCGAEMSKEEKELDAVCVDCEYINKQQ